MLAEGATNGDISRQPANWKQGTYDIRVIHLCCRVLGPLEIHPSRVQFAAERIFYRNESQYRIMGHNYSVQNPLGRPACETKSRDSDMVLREVCSITSMAGRSHVRS